MTPLKQINRTSLFWLAPFFIYFLVTTLLYLDGPGLSADEAAIGILVDNYLACLRAGAPTGQCPSIIPPVLNNIEGSTLTAYLALFLAVFGKSVFLLRACQVILSLITLACVLFVLSRSFNRSVGLVTASLLSLNSTFILATRHGNLCIEIALICFFWMWLALLQLYLDRKQARYLFLSALVLGLALNIKIQTLGYLFCCAVGWVAISRMGVITWLRQHATFKVSAATLFFFLLGSAHFWISQLSRGSKAFDWIWKNFSSQHNAYWDNRDLWKSALIRLDHFGQLLVGRLLNHLKLSQQEELFNPFNAVFFTASLFLILFYLLCSHKPFLPKKPIAFFLLLYVQLLALTVFVPFGGLIDQLAIMIPIVEIVEGIAIGLCIQYFRSKPWGLLLAGALIFPAVASEVYLTADHLFMSKHGLFEKQFSPPYTKDILKALQREKASGVINSTDLPMLDIQFITGKPDLVNEELTLALDTCKEHDIGGQRHCLESLYDSQLVHLFTRRGPTFLITQRGKGSATEFADVIREVLSSRGRRLGKKQTFARPHYPITMDLHRIH